MNNGADQEQFLGSLLGLAIGDAMGMPVAGWMADRIHERFGRIQEYHRRVFADGAEIKAGEFTDESELALCIVESFTANQGVLDPENIRARFSFLARGESKRWMGRDTYESIVRLDEEMVAQVALDEDGPATGDVAARGVPVGLIHAVGEFHADRLRADAELVTRLTHGSPVAIAATTAVAYGVQLAARGELPPTQWPSETAAFLGAGEVTEGLQRTAALLARTTTADPDRAVLGTGIAAPEAVASAFYAAVAVATFEDVVITAVNAGGATDTRAAIAGALAGAARGVSGIPQRLIDDLEGRIYVSLAAPWFYRAALRRAGLVIDLKRAASR